VLESLKTAYQRIGRGIVGVLPDRWRAAFVLFGPVASDVGCYAAFVLQGDGIYKSFKLPRPTYLDWMELWNNPPPDAGPRWASMTFVVQSGGTFDVEYSYEPLREEDELSRTRAWMLKHGIVVNAG
jgi:hypothetical protein